jgi:DNA-binding transcriptional LysR family regulator
MGSSSSTHASVWPGLELRHLLALVAVADTGSFSGAAEKLHYTQSAVSQQIANLERIVNMRLFERPGGPRPVQLTAAGETLLAHSRAVLARVGSAATDLRALASGESGVLRVGTLPSIGAKVLPWVLGVFRTQWPGIEVVLRESCDRADLLLGVERGDLDAALIEIGQRETTPLEVRPLIDDPMVFVAPTDSPEAELRTVSIADIAHLPMIGTNNVDCQRIIDDCFRDASAPPTFVMRSDDNSTIQGLIGSGLAYAVLPLLVVDGSDPSVAVIPIRPEPLPRRLGIAWHPQRQRPLALASFVEATAEICRHLGELLAARAA